MTGIPRECKRLAEVDFPIAEVGFQAAREKSIRHGHPSTLHLWWARRPLASSRSMLLALLLPDPVDPHCPKEFQARARAALPKTLVNIGSREEDLRSALLQFISAFANRDRSADPGYLAAARGLIRAASGDDPPLVLDPFAGGGSIPLEALRIGCDAVAADLNPVAGLLLRTLLEEIPRKGARFAEQIRSSGEEVRASAERLMAAFYPRTNTGETTIAYLWARTVACESPGCGAEIPLVRSFWLCNKEGRKMALRYQVHEVQNAPPKVELEVFRPRNEDEVPKGTVARGNATCPACASVLPAQRVRTQLSHARGGSDVRFDSKGYRLGGARLLAVVSLKVGENGRHYRIPNKMDYDHVWEAQEHLRSDRGVASLPDEPTPRGGGTGAGRAFSVQKYGMMTLADLFTSRQRLALLELCLSAQRVKGDAVRLCIALAISRCAEQMSSLVRWRTTVEAVAGTFGRQALPIVWDFVEILPFGLEGSNFGAAVEWVAEVAEVQGTAICRTGVVHQGDACSSSLPDGSATVWFTDPPYYDSVPYSDLSDFFFVWLKRALPAGVLWGDPFDNGNPLTPKERELVQDETRSSRGRPKDAKFFEEGASAAFAEGRRLLRDDGIGCVVFAHKSTEGWEALLSGIVRGGWVITASWPIATERPGRLRSQNSAALATSVHLVCRPRSPNAPTGEWADVVRELPSKVGDWMMRLGREGVRGADLVFACIGPAMEVYSRHSKVVDAQDREIPLGGDPAASDPHVQGYLAKVWEVVGRLALEQILSGGKGGSTGLEEDARLTALFLWTLQSSGNWSAEGGAESNIGASMEEAEDGDVPADGRKGGYSLVYDVARRFAQPLGIHLDAWEGGLIETDKGVVRLLSLDERATQLFGKEDVSAIASAWDEGVRRGGRQTTLFPDEVPSPPKETRRSGRKAPRVLTEDPTDGQSNRARKLTTLDRLHAAMLLQRAGSTSALKTFLEEERRRGPELERLATALSALYPHGSEERRLVEALSLAFPKK